MLQMITATASLLSDSFLSGCEMLEEVTFDFSVMEEEDKDDVVPINLPQITSIGWSFMAGCKSLRAVSLSVLTHITTIGPQFLAGCASLSEVDLTPFSGTLTTIESNFMEGCVSLKEIDLAPLSRLSALPDAFLSECVSLTVVDLSPLVDVTVVGDGCLAGCVSLHTVILGRESRPPPPPEDSSLPPNMTMPVLVKIGADFLRNCSHLTQIQFGKDIWCVGGGLGSVMEVGGHFMSGCAALPAIDLTPFATNTNITFGGGLLAGCSSLMEVDLSVLGGGRVFLNGAGLLEGCSSMTLLTLSDYQYADLKFLCTCLAKKGVVVDVVGMMGSSSDSSSF
jgi:hypothetical protein